MDSLLKNATHTLLVHGETVHRSEATDKGGSQADRQRQREGGMTIFFIYAITFVIQ